MPLNKLKVTAAVYLYRFNSAAARRIDSRKSRGTPVPRDIRKLRSQHIVLPNARRAVARVAENARAHRVDYGTRVFVICNLIIFLLTFAVIPVACTNSEWSRRHPPPPDLEKHDDLWSVSPARRSRRCAITHSGLRGGKKNRFTFSFEI